jgi:pimeloyl-ACP methyl ester carboxylesterase
MAYHGSRTLPRLLAALLLIAGALLVPRAADAATGAPPIGWSPCAEGFECATVDVPLDYDRPRGPTIAVGLSRLPATDPQQRIGSLFLNPGGPGGSGVDFVQALGPILFTPEVRARYDLVGFDPRGIARSNQVRCFDAPEQWEPYFLPFAFPLTREQERLRIAADHYAIGACERRAGPIVEHMSTANVARDLDVLRRRAGDDALHYAGYSYGSYLGATYAALYPGKVGAMVVDAVVDPVAWSTGEGREGRFLPFSTRLRSDQGAQVTLEEFFRLCDEAGPRCAFANRAAERFAALADRLRDDPAEVVLPDGTTDTIGYADLIGLTLGALYDPEVWTLLADGLADVERQTAAPVRVSARFAAPDPRPPYLAPGAPDDYRNELEGFPSVACSDSVNPGDYAAWSWAGAAADRLSLFGRAWTWASSLCADWPWTDQDRYLGPFDRATPHPVLVVGNRFDPATRYEGAVTLADLLPRSALLTVDGWGHTSLLRSTCADQVVARYLLDGATPAPGTACAQDVLPFSEPPA